MGRSIGFAGVELGQSNHIRLSERPRIGEDLEGRPKRVGWRWPMTEAKARFLSAVEQRGWSARVVRIGRLEDLRRAIEEPRARELLDATFARERLSFFSFDPPAELPEARSILVIAVPAPPVGLTFRWQDEAHAALLPPTYAGYEATTRRVQEEAAWILAGDGWRISPPLLPLKTLAVRSSLAEYGRNNIGYVRGMGSHTQLVGLFSDLPCERDDWREPVMLARCATCEACRRSCRGGAIPEDRFLLRAERCLTYHNERAHPFPMWIEPGWHHALMGCMRCQEVCPEDKDRWGTYQPGEAFDEDETALLLTGPRREDLPSALEAKLLQLELLDDLSILSRNLRALLRLPA
jgi:epoxyqueuosine reductase